MPFAYVSFLCSPWCRIVTWLEALCHPAVHSHSLDCWILWLTRRKREEVLPLLLLTVTASIVGAARGADAVDGRPPSAGWGVMRRAVSLRHVAWLAVVIVRWGAWLSLNADVLAGTDGDAGVSWPRDTNDWDEGVGGSLYICGCGVKAPSIGKKRHKRVQRGKVLTPAILTGVAMQVWSLQVSWSLTIHHCSANNLAGIRTIHPLHASSATVKTFSYKFFPWPVEPPEPVWLSQL